MHVTGERGILYYRIPRNIIDVYRPERMSAWYQIDTAPLEEILLYFI